MVRFRFKRGLRFKEGERSWTLKRQTATRKLQFEEEESGVRADPNLSHRADPILSQGW